MPSSRLSSFFRSYFRFEPHYFTVGGWRKSLSYFLKMGSIRAHLKDRLKFRVYPKLAIVADFPSHIDVEVASACQMRCPMCYTTHMAEHLKGLMKWDLYTRIIDEAVAGGIYSIKLSWRGEPMLNKRLIDMVRYAKDKGIHEVAFLSNAELLTKKMAENLVDAGLDWMSVSADGVGDIYNEIRAPAIFEETIERVRYMKQYRDGKGLTKPLLRVQSIMSAVENDSDTYYKSWEGVVDRINVISDAIRDFEDRDDLVFDTYYVCPKPWQRLTIAYDGKAHQCISDYAGATILGDVTERTIRDVWHGEEHQAVRKAFRNHTWLEKNDACRICSYGLAQENHKIDLGDGMNVRRFKSVPKIVALGEVQLKTPTEKLTSRQRVKMGITSDTPAAKDPSLL